MHAPPSDRLSTAGRARIVCLGCGRFRSRGGSTVMIAASPVRAAPAATCTRPGAPPATSNWRPHATAMPVMARTVQQPIWAAWTPEGTHSVRIAEAENSSTADEAIAAVSEASRNDPWAPIPLRSRR